MKVINKKISDLKMYEANPRNNDDAVDEVAKSIKEFGFKVPMVIDKDNVIICGHTRYKACVSLGIKEVPCVVADDLSEEQIKAFRLVENKTSELASWDFDLLEQELEDIDENIDMSIFESMELDTDVKDNQAEYIDKSDDEGTCVCPKCNFRFKPIIEKD